MTERSFAIPRVLHPVHGENAPLFDLLATYATGVVFGALTLAFAFSRVQDLPWWKAVVLFLVAADLSGGVVSCFSRSTDSYYAERPRLRWLFIFVHIVEPALLYLMFDGRLAYWGFLYVYAAAAASVVNVLQSRERQEIAAAALVTLGVVIQLPISLQTPYLAWFGPVFMLKLVLAFAVRRA
jgi:hypothetical protein